MTLYDASAGVALLRPVHALSKLVWGQLLVVFRSMSKIEFAPGSIISKQGEVLTGFSLLLEGEVCSASFLAELSIRSP